MVSFRRAVHILKTEKKVRKHIIQAQYSEKLNKISLGILVIKMLFFLLLMDGGGGGGLETYQMNLGHTLEVYKQ